MISLTILYGILIVFLLQLLIPGFTELFIFDPSLALTQPWRFFTSIFLHGGVSHLFFNGYALFLFGPILERYVGRDNFLKIFFGAGLLGSFLYFLTILLGFAPPIPALGASGAIYGILGALAVLLPDMVIYFWFFPMKMREAALFWFVIEFLGTFNPASGIASAAHLGGLIFGFLYAKKLVSDYYSY